MIFKEITAGNQMLNTRWSCSTEAEVIILPEKKETKDFCICDYSMICEYFEMAFTDVLDGSNEYKNDYRKFLINPISATSSFSFVIIDKSGVETVIYSDSEKSDLYGDVFEQGFNTDQPLQVGVNVKWFRVVNELGYGDYKVKLSQTDFSNETTNTTHTFRVVPFNTQRANGTIKVEINHVGVTMNGTNWTGLFDDDSPFVNMIRVKGRLVLADPEKENESIEDGNREDIPVQTKTTDIYSIAIERVPFDIGYSLVHDGTLMNWSVTDYNVFNEDLRNKELIVQSTSVTNTPDYVRKSYELSAKSNISKLNRKFV